ncbi:MAG: hypothetical protein NVV62_13080 [Terricaulis sp.]|nr:hypothetical protein [Terricaulis sp.]
MFGFAAPEQAGKWVEEYYDIIRSDRCVPVGHSVNANFAIVTALSVNHDAEEAIKRGEEGFKFFGYSLGHFASFGSHVPGDSKVWENFLPAASAIENNHGAGGIGTPEQVYAHCKAYADVGVDQIIFVQQTGNSSHEHICESLSLFAKEVMPRLKEGEEARLEKKARDLAPAIEAALARKPRMKEIALKDVPVVKSYGARSKDAGTFVNVRSDRGGGLAVVAEDPLAKQAKPKG